ncbi:hypothetical protein JCM3766R1_003821 [Sporobolomyces carnicolor]
MATLGNDPPPLTHVGRDTALLLGPQTIAWQISFFLFGIYLALLSKTVRDPVFSKFAPAVKMVNWVVFVLVLAYNVMAFVNNTYWMITTRRTPPQILTGWPLDFCFPTSAGVVGVVCQVFLSFRASVLIRDHRIRYFFLGTLISLALLSFAASISVTALAFILYNNGTSTFSYNNAVSMWLITSAVVDVLISIGLTVTLRQRVGLVKEVDSLLRRLMFVALRTASYTAIPAVAGAVVSIVYRDLTSPYSLLHFAFWMPLPCAYGISIYTTIATRKMIDSHLAASHAFHVELDQVFSLNQRAGGGDTGSLFARAKSQKTRRSSIKSKFEHPLAEIAPWAVHLAGAKRRSSRSAANAPPTSAAGGAPVARSSLPTTNVRAEGRRPSEGTNEIDEEKPQAIDDVTVFGPDALPYRPRVASSEVGSPRSQQSLHSDLHQLTASQRRRVTDQIREREREQEEAQRREDNQRAIWW